MDINVKIWANLQECDQPKLLLYHCMDITSCENSEDDVVGGGGGNGGGGHLWGNHMVYMCKYVCQYNMHIIGMFALKTLTIPNSPGFILIMQL